MDKTATHTAVIGYLRASTCRQELSPDAQREALVRWCEQHGAELVAVHEDLGVGGATALDKRPGLLAALDSLKRGYLLLVAKRDRLGREPLVLAMVERLAERKGARVASAAGEGSGDAPTDVLMRRMVDAFAEYERLVIRARTRAALAVKRARGEKTGGDVPFGYQLGPDGKTLEPHAGEQRAIELVRSLRSKGYTIRAIADELNRRDYAAKRGGRWSKSQVHRLAARLAA